MLGCKIISLLNSFNQGRKSGLVVIDLDSWLEDQGFESHAILDGNGVKEMPGLILAPKPGSFNNQKEKKYGQPNGAHEKLI